MWKRNGQLNAQRSNVFSNRALALVNVSLDDAGTYMCIVDDDTDTVKTRINIEVKSRFYIPTWYNDELNKLKKKTKERKSWSYKRIFFLVIVL